VQPLGSVDGFDMVRFRYAVCRHKYLELLCVRADAAPGCDVGAVDEVVRCLNDLEPVCPTHDDYNRLCLLLTTSRLADHPEYAGWNPSSARVQVFRLEFSLVPSRIYNYVIKLILHRKTFFNTKTGIHQK